MSVKKQVILPMDEYERLVAAQPEKVIETKTEYEFIHDEIARPANVTSAVFACIFCGLTVAGLFWGWGWWCAIPSFATIMALVGAGINP